MRKKIQLAGFAIVFFVIGYALSYIITINNMIPLNYVRLKPNIFGYDINDPDAFELYISCHSKNNNHVSYCYGYSDAMIQLAHQKDLGNCYDISPEEITDRMTDTKYSTRGPAINSYLKALESFNCPKESF